MIDLKIQNETLIREITKSGQQAMEARQVAMRLKKLLPLRLKEIKNNYAGTTKSMAQAERKALADEQYENFIEELIEINSEALNARVHYETHTMLYEARRTLRVFRLS